MDFRLTEEQNMIRDMTRKFVDEVVEPRAEELERNVRSPEDSHQQEPRTDKEEVYPYAI